ncbi:fatty acid synthase [Trueperella bonasi]|uniref:Fatty acid synthase n=1 Tax=Trueperella bonasi TaxID=312286 RepID=A0ABT9NEK1_9ACTO|nr:polyketide synthase [Trueperella bonasi]MDP9805807.1 fatty acid synthase [Trueperella bonasi]
MTLANQLNDGAPYVLQFAGQATPWRSALKDLSEDAAIRSTLDGVLARTDQLLAPVLPEITRISAGKLDLFDSPSAEAFASVPGILLAQYGALLDFSVSAAPQATIGHSQGVLAVALAKHVDDAEHVAKIVVLARLIGAAATKETRAAGAERHGELTPMMAVRGIPETALKQIVKRHPGVWLAIRNTRTSYTLSGVPAELDAVRRDLEDLAAVEKKAREDKTIGGAPMEPIVDFLDVSAPFHSGLLEPALAQVHDWVGACGLSADVDVDALAAAVLTKRLNWDEVFAQAAEGTEWIIDLGPGAGLNRITEDNTKGRGIGVVNASTSNARDQISIPGNDWTKGADWSEFAPKLARLDGGQIVVDTKFTRLTGRSPVLLAGMTPTTVEPDIVAAAANAGYWVEMAGGGQVTEQVFEDNLAGLVEQLEPGRTVQFNAMYMDRYLWNLQFGTQHIVSRDRESGAPIDGVVVSAGIPELEEGIELVHDLRAKGFTYVAFKPGTVAQIRQVLEIARGVEGAPVLLMVEDGHAGGHHSWEDLDQLLLATYEEIRAEENTILVAGGGLGVPERAAAFMTGEWALKHGNVKMPVDAIMIGTAAMTAKEAKTNDDVKQLLVDTPGVSPDDNEGWVGEGEINGGMTSGLSHLLADMYEIENSASAAARLIIEVQNDREALVERHDEIVEAINKTAKPYFGDLDEMTYAQVLRRYAELSHPWNDISWIQRWHELAQRVEARLAPVETGEIVSMFPDVESVEDPEVVISKILEAYPQAEDIELTTFDAAWFVELCRKYPKPVPFVPIIDGGLLRSWGTDGLWQSHDPRYIADQVRIIPGPVSVAGITKVNEPVAQILARYEDATIEALNGAEPAERYSRDALTVEDYVRTTPHIQWHGHLMTNPATVVDNYNLVQTKKGYDIVVNLDTMWDGTDAKQHAVRELRVPLIIPEGATTGAVPVVDDERLPEAMYGLLAATAGVGAPNPMGDQITELPRIEPNSPDSEFGEAHYRFSIRPELGTLHAGVSADSLPSSLKLAPIVPSAVLGMCWPSIYAALGSAIVDDYPVIEGLLNAVHLDHTENLDTDRLIGLDHLDARSRCTSYSESSSGRVVVVETELTHDGEFIGAFMERFAIRGRVFGKELPVDPPYAGGIAQEISDTPRSVLRRVSVTAPSDMTPFAMVSGDYNPIHTSYRAAKVAGMEAPLVHGMWLCAAAQHAVSATDEDGHRWHIQGWTYRMYGTVDLNDEVDISVERIGSVPGGGLILEVNCRVDKNVVSQATATVTPAKTAYVYPGQGVQAQGMALDERASSAAARDVWERADKHTRAALDFSILAIVRDNPQVLTANGVTYRHPNGVLNLTQFTQVALATVAFAQTERLREAGALVEGSYLAGHSLGEYNALAAYGQIFPLETVIEIVFHRGSTMHNLVPRDEEGFSNYQMGALRPNQFGVGDDQVEDYVASVAEATGEFIEIVNYNLAGQQYSIAGTIAGIEALAADAERRAEEAGGKRPFMLVPGIDVPFHSTVLRDGVPDFRNLLDGLLPAEIDPAMLVDRYIPNLVARPFELTEDFLDSILEVVPSETVRGLKERWSEVDLGAEAGKITRDLLVELLAWQFASPVRWIETQDFLFRGIADGGAGVENLVEIGLGAAPTLANLASRTLAQPKFANRRVSVYNVQRDEKLVYNQDQASAEPLVSVQADGADEAGGEAAGGSPAAGDTAPTGAGEAVTGAEASPAAEAAPAVDSAPATPAAPAPAASVSGPIEEITFDAADATRVLLADSNKLTYEQVGDADNVESLTNGVSSKRNQVLMDMSSELNLSSIDGAAEASVAELSKTVNKLAHNYKPFGPVLSEAMADRIRKLFGAAGLRLDHIGQRVSGTWGLGEGWTAWATAVILLDTREGKSARGGELTQLPANPTSVAEVDALIDAAVERVGALKGIAVAKPSAGGGAGGAVVDSAALDAFSDEITSVLADNARDLLERLGKTTPVPAAQMEDSELVEAVTAELGSNWPKLVAPGFSAKKAVLLNDRWATAREDLARLVNGDTPIEALNESSFVGTGAEVARQAQYYIDNADISDQIRGALGEITKVAVDNSTGEYSGQIAVVTGMTPDSIGGAVAKRLLAGGATVIATASRVDQKRLLAGRKLYRENARGDASLWLVPANLSSYRDIDSLVEWIGNPVRETVGGQTKEKKPAMVPDMLFPFAAPRVFGMMDEAGSDTESQARLMLWGLERLLTGLSKIGSDTVVGHRMHAVLPGSPNRGLFGGDGAYGEVKAAFDAIVNKWKVEPWADRVTLAHARIGWVRGTGLMGGNDPLVEAAEAAGVRTWSTDEMADQLVGLASKESREKARVEPIDADLTGGLEAIDFPELAKNAKVEEPAAPSEPEGETISALPSPKVVGLPEYSDVWSDGSARPEDTIVIVGVGEAGPWGSSRTRLSAELGIQADGEVDLTAAGVLELAWMTGLLTWHEAPKAGWYDAEDNYVDESEIYERFRDEVVARCGVRRLSDDGPIQDGGTVDMVTVFLDRPITFSVDSEEDARAYEVADPQFTEITPPSAENPDWLVTRKKGATTMVPRKTTLSRYVAGQLPKDFDPTRWGIPASMIESADKMAVWNLVTTVDAFISAGFEPAELLEAVHPTQIASTQGTGFGGMSSMRKLFVERFLGEDVPQDILQETLPNVIAAHTMQSYVGGYGAMVQPVAACASAAVSLEEGLDKIATGKAKFVVTGANDDISVESLEGFGFMNATADSASLEEQGIHDRFFSRAGDLRRGGFVEGQGGGTVLIARGDLALELGLPVYAVVGYVQTFADGAHTSIPAPGLGALAAGHGGKNSRMARDLAKLGVKVDDIAVLSKHDTSTNANDPNEAELHDRLAKALGRTDGNPLHVISQKTLTGHSKGGAALFQIAGLTQVFNNGIVPANRSLDNLDPVFYDRDYLVWLRDPLNLGKRSPIKAALATSLGFGHVSSMMAFVHPGAFEAAVERAHGREAADRWRERAEERMRSGARHLEQGMIGRRELYEPIEGRRFKEDSADYDAHEVEAAMLLDPEARLGADGFYAGGSYAG